MPSKTRSSKKAPRSKTRKANNKNKAVARPNNRVSSRKAMSVSDIRERFRKMDDGMREFIKRNNLNNPRELGKQVSRQWAGLFKKHLSGNAANELGNHYMNLHGKPNKANKRGGFMAPLDYVMRPGMPAVAAYATFPTEVGADPKASSHLDVYYNSALARSCGTENTTAHVPKDMGSNQVPAPPAPPAKGGARRRRTMRKRGGDFMLALDTRPYTADNPAGPMMRAAESWYGVAPYGVDSSEHSRSMGDLRIVSDGRLPINPDKISIVDKDITLMSNPSPYPMVR